MTRDGLHALLLSEIAKTGTQASWGFLHGIPAQNVSAMCRGDLPIAGKALEALGIKRVVVETFVAVDVTVKVPAGFSQVPLHDNGRIKRQPRAAQ
jgi:hypothetical protein